MSLSQNQSRVASLFLTALRRYGIIGTVIGLTFISTLLSVGISVTVNALLGGGPMHEGYAIAIITPIIITPVLAFHTFRLINLLDQAEQRLQHLSNTDELTRTYNRRYFMKFSEQELKRAQRYDETFSIAIIDMDNFKAINDRYGHLVGDQVLYTLSQLCKHSIRQIDVFARYGGDEFIFLFPCLDREQTRKCARRVFEIISSAHIRLEDMDIQPLLSMGVAIFEHQTESLDDILAEADRALYQAKNSGGNKLAFSFDN